MINQLREQVSDYTAILYKLREQALVNQRAEAQLNSFQETLRMRVAELSEVERLFEDRVKKQFEDFVAEFEKRWSKVDPRIEERWHEHDRIHHDQDERLEQVEAAPVPILDQVAALRAEQEKFVNAFVEAVTGLVRTEKSSLPNYPVSPAQMPEDGVGLPTATLDRR